MTPTTNSRGTLHYARHENLSLSAALKLLPKNKEFCGLLQSPHSCLVESITGGTEQPERRDVFEAAVFGGKLELRWINVRRGIGPAVIVSEGAPPDPVSDCKTWKQDFLDAIKETCLLWGWSGEIRSSGGIATLSEARIKPIRLPEAASKKAEQTQLVYTEYLGIPQDARHANCVRVERMLKRIEGPFGKEA